MIGGLPLIQQPVWCRNEPAVADVRSISNGGNPSCPNDLAAAARKVNRDALRELLDGLGIWVAFLKDIPF